MRLIKALSIFFTTTLLVGCNAEPVEKPIDLSARKKEILSLVQNPSISLVGKYSVNDIHHYLETVITPDSYYLEDVYDDYRDVQAFSKDDTTIYTLGVNQYNQIVKMPTTSLLSEWEEECGNPFLKLTEDNIDNITSFTFNLVGEEAENIVPMVTGWYEDLVEAKFVINIDDTYTFHLTTSSKNDGYVRYTFSVEWGVDAKDIRYSHETYSEKLQNAFNDYRGAKNYTVKTVTKDILNRRIESTYLRSGNVFYSESKKTGYVFKDSVLFTFRINDNGEARNVVEFGDEEDYDKFMLRLSFSGDLFKYDEATNYYVPKDLGALAVLRGDLGYSFDTYQEFSLYTVGLRIRLANDDTLDFIELDVNSYNGEYTVRIYYSNIGTTILPFEETIFEEGQIEKDPIKAAFEPLKGATNFTVKNLNVAVGEKDIESISYRKDNIFYDSYDKTGYAIMYRTVYSFDVDENGTIVNKKEFGGASEIGKFEMKFDLNEEQFTLNPNGYYVPKSGLSITDIAVQLSYSYDRYIEYSKFATAVRIKLTDSGELDYFEVTSNCYGFISTNKVTFSDIGTTVIPFDTSEFDMSETNGIPHLYNGVFQGEIVRGTFDGAYYIIATIDNGTLKINDNFINISSIKKNANGSIVMTFKYKGISYELADYNSQYPGESLQIVATEDWNICLSMELFRVN